MALIGNIAIGAGVNLGPFMKGLKLAGDYVEGFAKRAAGSMRTVVSSVANLAAAAVAGLAALGGASLSGMMESSEEAISNNADLAARIGATTEGLVGLQHGASLAGVETSALNAGLEKMQVNMAKAAL